MRKYRAVIFDMDGVIVDSEPLHERAFLEIFEEMGYRDNHGIDFKAYYGRSDRALWEDFVARHKPPYPFEHLVAWKQSRLIELLRRERPVFPEVPGLLLSLIHI
ncbi:MAG: HAD family phosphatase, partial [Verrucomicrobiae bacterium]|nr:HAD family phosphatase [Verrucomicrobiae bacterium]